MSFLSSSPLSTALLKCEDKIYVSVVHQKSILLLDISISSVKSREATNLSGHQHPGGKLIFEKLTQWPGSEGRCKLVVHILTPQLKPHQA